MLVGGDGACAKYGDSYNDSERSMSTEQKIGGVRLGLSPYDDFGAKEGDVRKVAGVTVSGYSVLLAPLLKPPRTANTETRPGTPFPAYQDETLPLNPIVGPNEALVVKIPAREFRRAVGHLGRWLTEHDLGTLADVANSVCSAEENDLVDAWWNLPKRDNPYGANGNRMGHDAVNALREVCRGSG
jgi:hypothetical protein